MLAFVGRVLLGEGPACDEGPSRALAALPVKGVLMGSCIPTSEATVVSAAET